MMCKCGCGINTKKNNSTYLRGHNKRGKTITKEHLTRLHANRWLGDHSPEKRQREQKLCHAATRAKFQAMCAAIKLERGCAICGYNKHPDALQWDHIEPLHLTNKLLRGPHRIVSLKRLQRAMNDPNMQILCGNCHNIKSNRERRGE